MGNIQENKYNKLIDFSVNIEKLCYLPEEDINGTLYLMGKPELLETQLNEPKVTFAIYEKLISYPPQTENSIISTTEKILQKVENDFMFNTFVGANLLIGINIPFKYKIPLSINPSLCIYIDSLSERLQHIFTAEFPTLKVKRAISIVIKNNQNFTLENKLLKIPCSLSERRKKSKYLINKGDFNITINLPGNIFYYDDQIRFEILLDLKNLNLSVKKIDISILRLIKKKYPNSSLINEIITKSKDLDKNIKNHVIKDELCFPHYKPNSKYIYLPMFYEDVEKEHYGFSKKSLDEPINKKK